MEKIKSQYNISKENHVLVSIGRLSKEKNLNETIELMHTIIKFDEQARLLIVGDGPERKNLEELVKEKKLSSYVFFAGEVNWKTIQNYYAVGDIFTSASTSETQGLTYTEAMASGRPILVRKDECLKKLLQEGVNGYSYQDEKEFIYGYQKLFEENRCKKMSALVEKSIREMSSEAFGRNIEKIYRSLL